MHRSTSSGTGLYPRENPRDKRLGRSFPAGAQQRSTRFLVVAGIALLGIIFSVVFVLKKNSSQNKATSEIEAASQPKTAVVPESHIETTAEKVGRVLALIKQRLGVESINAAERLGFDSLYREVSQTRDIKALQGYVSGSLLSVEWKTRGIPFDGDEIALLKEIQKIVGTS